LRPSADWDWAWVTQGSPKGHPGVTQGPPRRHARETHGSIWGSALFATKGGKMPGGGTDREIGESKTTPPGATPPQQAKTGLAGGPGRCHTSDQNLERSFLYVVGRSSGSTRVSPTELIKFTSPNQRGRICMWMCPATPAPAALPRFMPRFKPSGR
jgi:hypothetical protein